MASGKQIAANRQNAMRSTGPKTAAGKTTSSRNALKHGLLTAGMLLPDEDPRELAALAEAIRERLAPEGEMEHALVDRVVACLWRLRRVHEVEGSLYRYHLGQIHDHRRKFGRPMRSDEAESAAAELGRASIRDGNGANAFTKLARYETTIERGMYRALHELQRLQAERGARQTAPAAVDVDLRVTG